MLSPDDLMALASLAGQTVVAAAVTDTWDSVKHRFARLIGRGDPDKTTVAERRLTETHRTLTHAQGTDLERARIILQDQWVTRLMDLLEEDPNAEGELRALVQEIQGMLPASVVSASDRAVAAGKDLNITADRGSFAAGVIGGDVTLPGPTNAGSADS